MNFIIAARGMELTPGLRNAVESKLSKLGRYFKDDTEVRVTLSADKAGRKIEVTIPIRDSVIRAEETSPDMHASIDMVQETLIRQMRRYKTRLVDAYQAAAPFSKEYEDEDIENEDEIKITRTKKIEAKPMDPEEACLQMEMLNHSFYVFTNADTELINVVYKRKDGAYGLIGPES